MFEEFKLKDDNDPVAPNASPPLSPEEQAQWDQAMARVLRPEEQRRLELLFLQRLKQHKAELEEMLKVMNGHWTYEDHFYRFYHCSFKVYGAQTTTERAVKLLRRLLPERQFNMMFEQIIRDGTGKEFTLEHNRNWARHTRPILEAFCHAKFMVEMAVRYADLPNTTVPMPSGWAALLYLFDLR